MKHAILALLTQGPAYGLQIRNELTARLERQKPINVGQVYSTLERLSRDGYVTVQEYTNDGLPLYMLTEAGQSRAHTWLRTPDNDTLKPWETMVAQVLLTHSLPGVRSDTLVSAYVDIWTSRSQEAQQGTTLGARSRALLARAALEWLSTVQSAPDQSIPVSQVRPPKGRPPVIVHDSTA